MEVAHFYFLREKNFKLTLFIKNRENKSMIYNKDNNNTFIPKSLKLLDLNSQRIGTKIFENKKNINVYEEKDKKIFVKDELITVNYNDCFKASIFRVSCSTGTDLEGNPRDLCKLSLSYNNDYPFTLTLQNFWKAEFAGIVTPGNNEITKLKGQIRLRYGYFAIFVEKNLLYSSSSSDSEKIKKEGYISNWELEFQTSEDNDILGKLALSKVYETNPLNYNETYENQLLENYGIVNPGSSVRLLFIYRIGLGNGVMDTQFGYDIPFFSEKEYSNAFNLNLRTLKVKTDLLENINSTNEWDLPVNFLMKNQLIQVITNYLAYSWSNLVQQYCDKRNGNDFVSNLLVWCPDVQYLTYTCSQLNINGKISTEDKNPYKYIEFTFNIADKEVNDVFYFTFVFNYAKGEESYQLTYGIQVTVTDSSQIL